jgi:hypothetical protein
LSLRRGEAVATPVSYATESLVAGLQATIWVIFACLSVTGFDWINKQNTAYLKDWVPLITVFSVGIVYTFGTMITRLAEASLERIQYITQRNYFDATIPGIVGRNSMSMADVRLEMLLREQKLTEFLEDLRRRMQLATSTCFNTILITFTASILLATRTNTSWLGILTVIVGGLFLLLLFAWVWIRASRSYYIWFSLVRARFQKSPF